MEIEPYSKDKHLKFPNRGAYNYCSKNGKGYFFPKDDILYVPILTAIERGKGFGTKLLIELEVLVKEEPELNEIAIPNIINPFLLKIVRKRNYNYREEFSSEFGETVGIYYKTVKDIIGNK